jgi:penicillin amidase
MKWLKRIAIGLLVILVMGSVGIYFFLKHTAPQYEGQMKLSCLTQPVSVDFDGYGIPHIHAENKLDLMRALGYVHAQDRLFQMELMRRVGSGTLSEIVGHDGLKVDVLFRQLELPAYAEKSAQQIQDSTSLPYVQELNAYLEGLNTFLNEGPTPPEFTLMGIPKRNFELKDLFYITGALSYNFSQAPKTDPILDFIGNKFGAQHLKDLGLYHEATETFIPSTSPPLKMYKLEEMMQGLEAVSQQIPYPPLEGSNAWAISGKKTKSGKPLFCNDTHIGYMLPQTWYEAYIECPGFEMYGHFLAGVPFALIGRNSHLSWGVTMLLNDDMDYYAETIDPKNNYAVLVGDSSYLLQTTSEVIHIKGQNDTTIIRRVGPHGPIVNDVTQHLDSKQLISLNWTYTQRENHTFKGFWMVNQSTNLSSFQAGLPLIHAPGINMNYADDEGNIAWFATASLKKRSPQTNSWTILDGRDPSSLRSDYYSFALNPKSINPSCGYIYSANDWPAPFFDGEHIIWYPGYYKPQYRADRIRQLIETRSDWDAEGMKTMLNDVTNPKDAELWQKLLMISEDQEIWKQIQSISNWNGAYFQDDVAPTVYNTLLYFTMRYAMEDELGIKLFDTFLTTHQFQRSYGKLIDQAQSPWWDDVRTSAKENRKMIVQRAWKKTLEVLRKEYGDNVQEWKWSAACRLQIQHPVGKVALLSPLFNTPNHAICGGNETIHQSGFYLDSTAHFKVFFGSQMRIIVDFQDVRNGWNITPSGQSGHLMSPFYDDQHDLYAQQGFREQHMQSGPQKNGTTLRLVP